MLVFDGAVGVAPFPAALAVSVAVAAVGFEAVAVHAESGEFVEGGVVGVVPAVGVVDLGDGANGAPAGVDDGADVVAVAHDDLQQGVAEQVAGDRGGDGADAGDLTGFAVGVDVVGEESFELDDDDHLRRRGWGGVGRCGGGAGEVDEPVGGVGLR
jgi:hypothetical protein